jgi:hypothetical protein
MKKNKLPGNAGATRTGKTISFTVNGETHTLSIGDPPHHIAPSHTLAYT